MTKATTGANLQSITYSAPFVMYAEDGVTNIAPQSCPHCGHQSFNAVWLEGYWDFLCLWCGLFPSCPEEGTSD